MQDPWISLRNLWIPSSRRNPWIAQGTIYRFIIPTLPEISLLGINIARQVVVVVVEFISTVQHIYMYYT